MPTPCDVNGERAHNPAIVNSSKARGILGASYHRQFYTPPGWRGWPMPQTIQWYQFYTGTPSSLFARQCLKVRFLSKTLCSTLCSENPWGGGGVALDAVIWVSPIAPYVQPI